MSHEADFYFLVQKMREYQKAYFKTRDKAVLIRSKELEKQVDEAISRWINGG